MRELPCRGGIEVGERRRTAGEGRGSARLWAEARRGWALLVAFAMCSSSCGGSSEGSKTATTYDPNVARYRLLLRDNPVDSGEAFRCFGACQQQTTPDGYLGCLAECPGFEVTQGIACDRSEVPPVAACITARRLAKDKSEVEVGHVVIAVLANVALIVALGTACSQASSCGAYYFAPAPNGRY